MCIRDRTYTIGRLYILKDEDVKKRTIESVNKCRELKTVCEVPQEKLMRTRISVIRWSRAGAIFWVWS